jgi:hypothetical protein
MPECFMRFGGAAQWFAPHEKPAIVVFDLDVEQAREEMRGNIVCRQRRAGERNALAGRRGLKDESRIVIDRPVCGFWTVEASGQQPRAPFLSWCAKQCDVEKIPWLAQCVLAEKRRATNWEDEALHQSLGSQPRPFSGTISDRQVDAIAAIQSRERRRRPDRNLDVRMLRLEAREAGYEPAGSETG